MKKISNHTIISLPFLGIISFLIMTHDLLAQMHNNNKTIDTLILGDYVLTMNQDDQVIKNGAVAINEGKIVAVDQAKLLLQQFDANQVIEGTGRIVMPGLINGHTHSAMTLFRGIADDLALMDWLQNYIFPLESQFVNEDFVRVGVELACYEMIRSGTTTFVDMYFYPRVTAEVTKQSGLRAIIGASFFDFASPGFKGFEDSFNDALAFVEAYQNKHSRIIPALGPHALYTLSKHSLQKVAEASTQLSAPILMHLDETRSENQQIISEYGQTPTALAESIGLFNQQMIAAHAVHLNKEDIATLAKTGVGVVHNPSSNLKLASGAAPISELISAGVKVGLGTDGAASNNKLDLFAEMRLASFLQKHESHDPRSLPAKTVVSMATRLGAESIGLGDKIGQLQPGFEADLIQITVDDLITQPMYDVYSHLVYVMNSRDVVLTMVAGHILYEHNQTTTIDSKPLFEKVTALSKLLTERNL